MFPMQITLSNIGQLNAVLTALCLDLDAPVVHAAPEPTEPSTAELIQIAQARKDAAAPSPKPKAVKTAPSLPIAEVVAADAQEPSTEPPAPQPVTVPAATASSAAEPVTYARVSQAITEGAKASRQHVVDTLAKFGAKKGTELAPAQYGAFLAALG